MIANQFPFTSANGIIPNTQIQLDDF